MLSDACHEFLSAFAELARELAEKAHYYSAPNQTVQYGEEIDTLRRVCLKVANMPVDAEDGANLLRLAASVLRYHDTPPDIPEWAPRERDMIALVRLLQSNVADEEAPAVPALVEEIAMEGPGSEAAASKLGGMLSNLGKPTYDLAVKIVSDIGSATVKRMLGL